MAYGVEHQNSAGRSRSSLSSTKSFAGFIFLNFMLKQFLQRANAAVKMIHHMQEETRAVKEIFKVHHSAATDTSEVLCSER